MTALTGRYEMYGMDSKSGSTEMKLLRVDMGTERIQSEDVAEHYALLGGRGLIAALLLAELEPACDPQGPDNRLVICNGLLAGTLAASSGRISVGGKSPLTGTIKEANAGARLEDAPELALRGTYDTCDMLRARYGDDISILCIGPAGERRYLNSSVQVTDREGRPARAAARGGLGGVMGARGLKAVVLQGGKEKPVFADAPRFRAASKAYMQALRKHPMTGNRVSGRSCK